MAPHPITPPLVVKMPWLEPELEFLVLLLTRPAASYPEIVAFNQSIPILEGLGATVMDNANFPRLAEWRASTNSTIVLKVDFEHDVANYFKSLRVNPTGITTLAQLINFIQTDRREDWPDRNTVTWEQALALNVTQTSPNYTKGPFADLDLGSNATIEGAINQFNLDALILPISQAVGVTAIAGYPVVTVPLG